MMGYIYAALEEKARRIGWILLAVAVLCLLVVLDAHAKNKVDTTHEIEDTVKCYLQLEDNIYHDSAFQLDDGSTTTNNTHYINGSVECSERSGWDVEIASYNIPIHGGGMQNHEMDTYINVSKTTPLYGDFKWVAGTENGTVFGTTMEWHNAEYLLLKYQPSRSLELHAGNYFVNKKLSMTTDYIGYTTGFTVRPYPYWNLEGDYYSGSNNQSGAQVNLWYRNYYIGVVVPEHNSGNEFAGVVGFKLKLY